MAGHPGSDPALGIQRIVDGAGDIVLLVVEPGGDLVEAARLGTAFAKLRPAVDQLPRRPAIAAAGEVAEGVGRHLRGLQTELEAVDFARVRRRLRPPLSDRAAQGAERDQSEPGNSGGVRCRGHFFIGSHCLVSVPQNATQSS